MQRLGAAGVEEGEIEQALIDQRRQLLVTAPEFERLFGVVGHHVTETDIGQRRRRVQFQKVGQEVIGKPTAAGTQFDDVQRLGRVDAASDQVAKHTHHLSGAAARHERIGSHVVRHDLLAPGVHTVVFEEGPLHVPEPGTREAGWPFDQPLRYQILKNIHARLPVPFCSPIQRII